MEGTAGSLETTSKARLWDTALKCFFRVLEITSPDHLVVINGPPLHETVTWYKICHVGWQATHWGIQNKEKSRLAG